MNDDNNLACYNKQTYTAYYVGYSAFHFYISDAECPYPEGSDERDQWIKGWYDAARDLAARCG